MRPAVASADAQAAPVDSSVPGPVLRPLQAAQSVEQQVLASAPDNTPAVRRPAATIVLATPSGRTAEIDLAGGPALDEYTLRLVSLKIGESAQGSAARDLNVGEIGLDQPSRSEVPAHELSIQTVQMLGISLTVGAVWWALRVSGLLASLVATLPAWRHLDPLLILPDDEEREAGWGQTDDESGRDEAAVGELLAAASTEYRR